MRDSHLTEINNAHLFMEYLRCSGFKLPGSRCNNWELVMHEEVIARIKKDSNGQKKFFICAALIGRK
ncbi:hypothetical protein HNR75_000495 [Tolumonas osonensis]|uniref:Uncharacterized protein n=1 Tax=Tolumonas osonensis TaxID=675874 RepID=A0A841GM97_9GAMM|nr:hypothetical protein [Tolumonas osonensis]